jgi:anion-transporting  ArsA/GET3 family ATPase
VVNFDRCWLSAREGSVEEGDLVSVSPDHDLGHLFQQEIDDNSTAVRAQGLEAEDCGSQLSWEENA